MKKIIIAVAIGFLVGTMGINLYGDYQEVLEVKEDKISTLEKEKVALEHELGEVRRAKTLLKETAAKTLLTNSKLTHGEVLHLSKKERNCLLRNVYYEAGIEPFSGKIAIAQVTLKRLKEGRWGKTFCEVVHARSQFSWTKRRKHETPKGLLWEETKKAVELFEAGLRLNDIKEALFYHADWIEEPYWVDKEFKVAQIGQHVFYKDAKKK